MTCRPLSAVLVVALAIGSPGCAPAVVEITPLAAIPAAAPTSFEDRDWATVLLENVKNGLVDYDHLGGHREALDRFLGMVAVAGPERTPDLLPSADARVAYFLNVYNAGVLAAVLSEKIPPSMNDVQRRSLDEGYVLVVDGRRRTLDDLREAARRESVGDARVEFCMCSAAKGSPPLRSEPFRATTLDAQLSAAARDAMDSASMVTIDHENERLDVALVILSHQKAFLDYYGRRIGVGSPTLLNVLMHLASNMRREWLATAAGYEIGAIPFDRSLNRWTP